MRIKNAILNAKLDCVFDISKIFSEHVQDETDLINLHIFADDAQMQRFISCSQKDKNTQICMNFDELALQNVNIPAFSANSEKADGCDNNYKNLSLDGCVIDKCDMSDFKITRSSFIDVIFNACNFSNATLTDCYFLRCELQNCKGVGADFSSSNFKDVIIKDCNFTYANFSKSQIKNTKFLGVDLSYGYIDESKLKDVDLDKTKLIGASFYQTPLKNIDLSTCDIANITISNTLTELTGLIISPIQAPMLVKYLGVIIKP